MAIAKKSIQTALVVLLAGGLTAPLMPAFGADAPAKEAASESPPEQKPQSKHKEEPLEHKSHAEDGYYSSIKQPKKEYFSDNQKRHADEGYYVDIKPYAPPPPEPKPVAPPNAPPVEALPPPLVVPTAKPGGEDTGTTGSVLATRHAKQAKEFLESGQFELAKKNFKESLAIAPAQPDLYPGYWECCTKTGDWSEAQRALEKLFELAPAKRSQYCWALGQALYQLRRYERAVPVLKEALKYGKNVDECHQLLLKMALQQHDNAAIASEYTAMLKSKPSDYKTQLDFANMLELQGKHADALTHYRAASNLMPSDAATASRVAYMLMFYNKDYKTAINYYQKAMMADPAGAGKYQDSIKYCQYQMQPAAKQKLEQQ